MTIQAILHPSFINHSNSNVYSGLASLFNVVEETFALIAFSWNYCGKSISLSKQMLNIFLKGHSEGKNYEKIIQTVLSRLQLLSGVSLAIAICPFKKSIENLATHYREEDYSSTAYSITAFSMNVAEILDGFSTFSIGLKEIIKLPPIHFITKHSMAYGYFLNITGFITRISKLVQAIFFYNQLQKIQNLTNSSQWQKETKNFLSEKVSLNPNEKFNRFANWSTEKRRISKIINKKERSLIRNAGAKVTIQVQALAKNVNEWNVFGIDTRNSRQVMNNLQIATATKIVDHIVSISANILNIIGLVLFTFSNIAFVPHVFLASAFIIRLGDQFFKDFRDQKIEQVFIANT